MVKKDHILIYDQAGYEVLIKEPPRRIISLVPSITELLFYLGLNEEIVGITKFCKYPKDRVGKKKIIGGTKSFHFDVIKSLQPDLIIGNKEENYLEGITQLKNDHCVWLSDVNNLDDAKRMILYVGSLTGSEIKASLLLHKLNLAFQTLTDQVNNKKALYFIWKEPYMAAGHDTFINDMLIRSGFQNVLNTPRYPKLSEEDIKKLNPDYIFISSEPFPFNESHIKEFKAICPKAIVCQVDGEMFSWYGSRLLAVPNYFKTLLKSLS